MSTPTNEPANERDSMSSNEVTLEEPQAMSLIDLCMNAQHMLEVVRDAHKFIGDFVETGKWNAHKLMDLCYSIRELEIINGYGPTVRTSPGSTETISISSFYDELEQEIRETTRQAEEAEQAEKAAKATKATKESH